MEMAYYDMSNDVCKTFDMRKIRVVLKSTGGKSTRNGQTILNHCDMNSTFSMSAFECVRVCAASTFDMRSKLYSEDVIQKMRPFNFF